MNQIDVSVADKPPPCWSGALGEYAQKVLAEIGRDNWDLSVLLCGDETIKALNAQYRDKQEATDVLSFSLGATEKHENGEIRCLPGDIVISLDTLKENARYFKTSEDEELRRLLIHGILHLDGMDHQTNGDAEPMLVLQENILNKLKNERIIGEEGKGK